MPNSYRDQSSLTREQKTGFVFLLIFGILTISLGVLQLRNTIYNPFVIRLSQETVDVVRLFDNEEGRLQQIDTDQDGLNDFEELKFFNTSPYIPDTDSDGIRDKDEIDAGTDPLCPEGEICQSSEEYAGADPNAPITSPLANQGDDVLGLLGSSLSEAESSATNNSISLSDVQAIVSDPVAIRELLRANGTIPREQLDQIDDATLLNLAAQILPQQGSGSLVEPISSPASTTVQ